MNALMVPRYLYLWGLVLRHLRSRSPLFRGKRAYIRFHYDGTDWTEVRRRVEPK